MMRRYLKYVLNFSAAGNHPSRQFWAALRLSIAVTFLSGLVVLAFAGIHRAAEIAAKK